MDLDSLEDDEYGISDAGIQMANSLSLKEECTTSGNIVITRDMLDKITTTRIINLDNK